ncbi:hypothetical protein GCM10027564_20700 [Luteimonas notoginsengisoli]
MPFTRISIPAGTPAAHKAAIARGVHDAMVAAIGIPEDDLFQLLSEYQPGDFLFDRGFLGVQRSGRPRISARRTCSSISRKTTSPTGGSATAG